MVLADGLHGPTEADEIGNRLLALFDAPFKLSGAPMHVGLTIGFALAPTAGRDTATVLRLADGPMYRGKQSSKGRLQQA